MISLLRDSQGAVIGGQSTNSAPDLVFQETPGGLYVAAIRHDLMASDEPCRVLVLDDEALILLDLEYAVEEAGCAAVTAINSDEALKLIASVRIAAAIVDVNLARGCTCEPVVRELVARGIPYVLHTGDLDRLDDVVRNLGGVLVSKPTPAAIVVSRALGQISEHSQL